ncbi:MAG: HEAT repeat domain-containing protein [Planctomycetota bacterium]
MSDGTSTDHAELAALGLELAAFEAFRRVAAAERLARLAEGAAGVAAALVKATGDDEEAVREWAVAALEACGPPPADSGDELILLLDSPSLDVAYWAATLLGRLGQATDAATSALARSAAGSPHSAVRRRAAWALEKIRRG